MISLISGFWGQLSVESQPQNPEFRNNPEKFHPMRNVINQLLYILVSASLQIGVPNWKFIFLFLNQTFVVGTQNNRLNETVLLSTQITCLDWWLRK